MLRLELLPFGWQCITTFNCPFHPFILTGLHCLPIMHPTGCLPQA
jgi:hypothetical protein